MYITCYYTLMSHVHVIIPVLTVGWKENLTKGSEGGDVVELCAEIKLLSSTQVIGYNLELATRLVPGGTSGMHNIIISS